MRFPINQSHNANAMCYFLLLILFIIFFLLKIDEFATRLSSMMQKNKIKFIKYQHRHNAAFNIIIYNQSNLYSSANLLNGILFSHVHHHNNNHNNNNYNEKPSSSLMVKNWRLIIFLSLLSSYFSTCMRVCECLCL